MNGFIVRKLGLGVVLASVAAGSGCMGGARYHEAVDPCYPQRYNAAARASVISYFAPQVQNGHVLDQTIWNHHFEAGKATLTPGGQERLAHLVRRRPQPDPRIFLQTAHDIAYDGDAPEEFVDKRQDLDQRRVYAVQHFLAAQMAARPME